MAIFGDLEDLPIHEVFTMLSPRTGILRVWNLPTDKFYEFHLYQNSICGLRVNNIIIDDVLQVKDCIIALINLRIGNFEFDKKSMVELLQKFRLPVEYTLLSTVAALDEIDAYRTYFPNAQTRFIISGSLDLWLGEDLYTFGERTFSLLERGSSAQDIAHNLGLNLEYVQLNLYKLRSAGKLMPVRAFESLVNSVRPKEPPPRTLMPSPTTMNPSPPHKPGFIRRMINALTFNRY